MNIALIGTRGIPPNYGGSETYVEQLALQLASLGDEIWVYGDFIPPDSHLRWKALSYPPCIHRVELPTLRTKHADNFIRSLLATLHVCSQRKIEVVQFNNIGSALFAFLPRLFGKKVVGAIRAMDSQRGKWGLIARTYLRICERLIYIFPHTSTTNSKATARYYRDRYGVDIHYIPNGITAQMGNWKPNEIFRWGLQGSDYLLFVGRVVPEKGCHILLDAFEKLDWPGVKLVIAGGESFTPEYVRRLKRCAQENVLFVGHVDGEILEELYANAFAFVLPSAVEGMSNALLSAMAHGCPVVISDIPENIAVVEDAPAHPITGQKPALAFRLNDAVDLAKKLGILRDNPEETEWRGACLKAHAHASYSWEVSARETRAVYEQLLLAH